MSTALLLFAVVLGCLAVGVAMYCTVVEAAEAWQISHHGWTNGHRTHH